MEENKQLILGEYPTTWNALTKKELLKVCVLFSKQHELIDFKVRLMFSILKIKVAISNTKFHKGISKYLLIQKRKIFTLSAYQINDLCNKISFIWESNTLTENKLPIIKVFKYKWLPIRIIKLVGPESHLFNITYGEYLLCESYVSGYQKFNNINYLNTISGILYRQINKQVSKTSINYKGDIRQVFNSNLVDKYTKIGAKIPYKYKLAIFTFYTGCISSMPGKFPLVFKSSESLESQESTGLKTLKLTDAMAEQFNTSPEQIDQYPLYSVLARMERLREIDIKTQEMINKAKRK